MNDFTKLSAESEMDRLAHVQPEEVYPDCYLHVQDCRDRQSWIVPIKGKTKLDLKKRVKDWIKIQFLGEYVLDGDITNVEGHYYARIMTDGRPPDSIVCWTSGGFDIKTKWAS